MSCSSLSRGFDLACFNESPGGISHIVVAPFVKGAINERPALGVLDSLPTSLTQAFKFELKNSANVFNEVSAQNIDARSNTYTQTLTAVFNSLGDELREEVYQMTLAETWVFVYTNGGDVFFVGPQRGVTTSSNLSTGGDFASGANITLTMTAEEGFSAPSLGTTAITALNALIA